MIDKLDPAVIVEALASLWPACFTADARERRPAVSEAKPLQPIHLGGRT